MHLENLPFNYEEAVAVLLFVIGFCMLLFSRNLIKKVIGLDIMDSGIFLLLADRGYIAGRTAPIIVDGVTDMSRYVNPIPAGLVLTGIVGSVSVSAVMLSLTVRIYKTYRTLDVDKLYMMISHKKKRRDRRSASYRTSPSLPSSCRWCVLSSPLPPTTAGPEV